MKKSSLIFTLAFIFTTILTGCASMFGNDKTVELITHPADPTVIVYDHKGALMETLSAPSNISFKKARNYTVEVSRTDYIPETISFKRKFNHSFWFNFLVSGIGVSTALIFDPHLEFQRGNYFAYAGYGIGALGIIGVLVDVFSGSLVGMTPENVNVSLKLTPEAMAIQEAKRQAEIEEIEARRQAEAIAEAKRQQEIEETRRAALAYRSETRTFSALNLLTNAQRAEYLKISEKDFTVLAEAIGGNISQLSPKTFVDRAKALQKEANQTWLQYMALYPSWQSATAAFYLQRPNQARIFETQDF